ncbi:MAG: IclR family transcriptional regulator [Alphaproteobacteria bacterium]|nr:IclR family transcriptional regulator [Alphaproteobacteria bacterium]
MEATEDDDETQGRDYVTALARGLAVMRAFSDQAQRLTLSEVARIVALPRASVRRALFTLEKLGYVEVEGRFFSLAPQVLRLAQAYLSSSPVPRVAQNFLELVSERLGQSCSLSILHEDEVIYIARSTRKRLGSLHRDVGTHLPAHCTSMGRVLLAALPPTERDQFLAKTTLTAFTRYMITDKDELRQAVEKAGKLGHCLVDQELEIDLRSLAIPIRNASGRVIAAMNVSARASTTSKKEMLDSFLPVLREAAANMRPLLIG